MARIKRWAAAFMALALVMAFGPIMAEGENETDPVNEEIASIQGAGAGGEDDPLDEGEGFLDEQEPADFEPEDDTNNTPAIPAAKKGAFAAISGNEAFIIIQGYGGYSLYGVMINDGVIVFVDSAIQLSDVIAVDNALYYLRHNGQHFEIASRDVSGEIFTVNAFNPSDMVESLYYWDGALYCLVNKTLTRVDLLFGGTSVVSDQLMTEYAIGDGLIFYVSNTDKTDYVGPNRTQSVGKLYVMKSDGTSDSLLFDHGVDTLKLSGDHIYFHNLNDSYPVKRSDNEEEWLEGHLYRMSIETGQSNAVRTEYDWDYFPADAGLVVFTENKLELESFYGLGSTILYAPEIYTDMALIDNSMLLYEYDSKRLVRVWLSNLPHTVIFEDPVFPGPSGEQSRTEDENGEVDTIPTIAPIETDSSGATPAPTPTPNTNTVSTPKPASTPKPSATPKPGDSSYIFPKSNKEKLTRADIEKVDSDLWAYGRNEILARHGYKFKTKKYADYFAKKSWYNPGGYSSKKVSSIEWYNMDLLKEMEAELTGQDNNGENGNDIDVTEDYIFPYSDRQKLTKAEIREVDKSLWSYGRNEILARHGYKFKTKKYADYFASKSWYKPGGYKQSNVTAVEWYNMELLKEMEDGG